MLRWLVFVLVTAISFSAQAQVMPSFPPGAFDSVAAKSGAGGPPPTFLTAPIFNPQNSAAGGASFQQVTGGPIASGGANSTAAVSDLPIATSGVISNFCITSSFTGTGSNYWTYSITYDDVDQTLSVNTLSITAGTPVCDITHTVSYVAGHKLTVHKVATGSPTNDQFQSSYLMTDSNGQFGTLFFANPAATTTVGTQQYFGNGLAFNATEAIVSVYFPTAGHVDDLYTQVTAATSSHFWTFTVYHDTQTTTPCDTSASTSLSVVYASGASGISSDLTSGHGFNVAAGDCISIGVIGDTSVMTATHLYASVRWAPTTNYLYPEMAGGTTVATVTSARFVAAPGAQAASLTATESQTYNLVPTLGTYTMTIANLSTLQSTTIGTTRAWTMRHGTGTQASINPTCSATTATTGCTSSNSSVSGTNFSAKDWIEWQETNTATATATTWHKESFTTNVQ